MSSKNEALCRCGHSKYVHDSVGAPIWESWCNSVGKNPPYCDCNEFRLDNLAYMEECYKKKGNKKK